MICSGLVVHAAADGVALGAAATTNQVGLGSVPENQQISHPVKRRKNILERNSNGLCVFCFDPNPFNSQLFIKLNSLSIPDTDPNLLQKCYVNCGYNRNYV